MSFIIKVEVSSELGLILYSIIMIACIFGLGYIAGIAKIFYT